MAGRTFEQWVQCIFDHPVTDPAWHWGFHVDQYDDEPNEVVVEYLTRLFREGGRALRRFDDGQVDQGLNFLASPTCSKQATAVVDERVPWRKRRDLIRSIYDLYAGCFAVRCGQSLGHLDEKGSPLNRSCYMWWDVTALWADPDTPGKDEAGVECLAVMERCLTIRHDACIEGALHGMGHWQYKFPERVKVSIDTFLGERAHLRPELVRYARRARVGNVA